jgi:hypothetical protein
MEMIKCSRCSQDFPELRLLRYGLSYCVRCSTTQRVGGVTIANHKTGNEIQIVPLEIANNINRLASRKGYGVCSGMKHN